MGLLVDGHWRDQWYDTKSTGGRFVRKDAQFRNRITADGSSGFKAESGRYHLYVSYACPWAHRTLIQAPGVAETVHMDHIKEHYYRSHPSINPTGVVPLGPEIDLTEPHGRESAGQH